MRLRGKALLLLGLAAVADLAVGWVSCSGVPRPPDVQELANHAVPIDLGKPYSAGDYGFLDHAVGSASVVQLGESLHITQEFPRVRVRLIKYLHEHSGFDVLALEGSLTQTWLAQEHLYRSPDPPAVKVARAQEMAWFKLWDTEPMRELMAYVSETQSTPHPLYLTSFDIQVGTSAVFGEGEDVIMALFDALRGYGPPPDGGMGSEATWRRALDPVVHCFGKHPDFAEHEQAALSAVDALEAWITRVAPLVEAVGPPAHAAALRMIPDNFRDEIELCARTSKEPNAWQRARDELNAINVVSLRDHLSSAHKILVWAHHSHVAYTSTHKNIPSMGEHLHQQIGSAVYTVGLFAGEGRVISADVLAERGLPSVRKVGVEQLLAAVGQAAYFVDLRSLPVTDPEAGWLVENYSRMETLHRRPTVLARDFDAAVFIAEVHPAPFLESRLARWTLRIWGFVVEHALGAGIVLVIGIGYSLWSIARRVGRWIRARRRPPDA
jgi:erythromycin esterase